MNQRMMLAVSYVLLIGLAFPIMRYFSVIFDVLSNNAVRFLSAGVLFIGLSLWNFKAQIKTLFQQPKSLVWLALVAMLMCFNMYFFTEGLKYTSAITGSIFSIISMPIAILVASLFYPDEREKVKSWRFYLGAAIALAGSFAFVLARDNAQVPSDFLRGSLFMGLSITIQAFQNVVVKKLSSQFHAVLISASTATLAGLIYLAAAQQTGSLASLSQFSSWMLILLGLAGIYGLVTGMLLAFYIVQKQGLVFLNTIQLLVPISTAVMGYIFLNESLSVWQLVSMAVVILGCSLVLKVTKKKE